MGLPLSALTANRVSSLVGYMGLHLPEDFTRGVGGVMPTVSISPGRTAQDFGNSSIASTSKPRSCTRTFCLSSNLCSCLGAVSHCLRKGAAG